MKLQREYDTDRKVKQCCSYCLNLDGCSDGLEGTCDDFLPEDWWKGSYDYINGTWYLKNKAEWVPM